MWTAYRDPPETRQSDIQTHSPCWCFPLAKHGRKDEKALGAAQADSKPEQGDMRAR